MALSSLYLEIKGEAIKLAPLILEFVAILLAGIIIARGASFFLTRLEKDVVSKTDSKVDDIIFPVVKSTIIYVIYAGTIVIALGHIGVDPKYTIGVAILLIGILFAHVFDRAAGEIQSRVVTRTETQLDDVVFPLLRRVIRYSIYIVSFIMALDQIGIEVVPVIAGMGIAGLAVGLAAKDTIANVISGIFIIIDKPFVLGDRIEIWSSLRGHATWGDVIGIGLRSTKIRTTDNIVIVIPNSEIARRDIVNYTSHSPKIRIRIPIGISYESDLKRAREILLEVSDRIEGISKDPPPKVIVKNFGESSVDLELRIWIEDARERRRIISEISTLTKKVFDDEGIEIPYPKRHIILEDKK